MASNFNMNIFDFEQNKKVQYFLKYYVWPYHDANHKQIDTR